MELIKELVAGGYNVRLVKGKVVATRGPAATMPIAKGQVLLLRLQNASAQREAVAYLSDQAAPDQVESQTESVTTPLPLPPDGAHVAQEYLDFCAQAIAKIETEPQSALTDARIEMWTWKRLLIAGVVRTASGAIVAEEYRAATLRVAAMKSIDEARRSQNAI